MKAAYRYKFDFDSEQPIPAHDPSPSLFNMAAPWLIDNMLAIDVVLAGAWAVKWVYYGGYHVLISGLIRFCPGLYTLATTGQLGG
ncbi:hypothetical protein [Paenibacillus sp. HJGM_3]|uniref:hypothetical protein n=1 Tax=Paenibacillus sp. HJGM_3 TaxID=3379816 RepID=UPI00385E7147